MAAAILVTGASGAIGSRVVEQLRGQGRPVRCLVRRRPVANADEVVRGDLGDRSTLDARRTAILNNPTRSGAASEP